jgi:serine/threonine protein kinase
MYDIAFGCSYLHGRRPAIIHRDLKSPNILIDSQQRAKISDFGLSKIKKKVRTFQMHTVCGTPNWQAPEMWKENPEYTEKVDVYSCALIFWEILEWSNVYPFPNMNDFQIFNQVGEKNLRPKLNDNSKFPKALYRLIESMWDKDPDNRPSINKVVEILSDMMK